MTTNDAIQTILSRRSIRRYTSQDVPKQLIEQILNAGIWAPSAHNRQPWRFVILQSFEQKHLLATNMGNQLRSDLMNDGLDEVLINKDVNRSYERMTQAPALIVMCLSMIDMDTYPDAKRNANERIMAIQSVAMAGQNILLAAHQSGLGACWVCAPLFCPEIVSTTLDLPEDWEPQGLISLGFPAQTKQRDRRPLETSILWR